MKTTNQKISENIYMELNEDTAILNRAKLLEEAGLWYLKEMQVPELLKE